MSEERNRILTMLAEGKITAQEAGDLLDALGAEPASPAGTSEPAAAEAKSATPKFLYVKVTGSDTVDVRVPFGLLRAGMRLTSLIPKQAMDQINGAMRDNGITFDFNNIKPDDIEELLRNLAEIEVNVDARTGDHVRVFCGG